ncbi:MAG: HEPN domain-containing protein [Chloroflexota bacterium]
MAQRDWFRVGVHVRVDDPAAAGFFLQQCLEKFLKGWLLARGWQLRKTHELDRLLDAATGFEPSLGSFRGLCERISGYYIVERYPGNYVEGPDADQIERDLDEARSLIETLFPTIDLRA